MYTSASFWISILGAAKLIVQGFGYDIPDQVANDIANGVAALLTVYGIFKNHGQ